MSIDIHRRFIIYIINLSLIFTKKLNINLNYYKLYIFYMAFCVKSDKKFS